MEISARPPDGRSSQIFVTLATIVTLLTFGLIVFGAIVRITESGLGCGNKWPLCEDGMLPPLENTEAWIEWLHRLFAILIGVLGLGMLRLAWREYRLSYKPVWYATLAAAILYAIQSLLGAVVVVNDLPPTLVAFHLGTAMLLVGSLATAGIAARYPSAWSFKQDRLTLLVYGTAFISLLVIVTGALVRGSGATLACLDWPLCDGKILPNSRRDLQTIQMMHRFVVIGFGVNLLLLVWLFVRDGTNQRLRWLAIGAFAAYLSQAAIGALVIWTKAAEFWAVAHVGFATTTWLLLVILGVIGGLQYSERLATNE